MVTMTDSNHEDTVAEPGPTPPAQLQGATDQNEGGSDPPLHDELPISYRRRTNQCEWLVEDDGGEMVEILSDQPDTDSVACPTPPDDHPGASAERPALMETTPTRSTTLFTSRTVGLLERLRNQ